ncbi:23S rRNA (guanine(2445)-N(2))/(guanine(2069)-N(7))-methyltransferase, partial [Pseudoalteromonas ruthenica]
IREHLAAALVKRSGWLDDITQPLFDPCCGSGTLLIEAAGMANNAPTNTEREFAFKRLPSFRKAKFDIVKAELKEQQQDNNLWLIGSDIDSKLV